MLSLRLDENIQSRVNEITVDVMSEAGIHFGHPYFNTATMAGIYRMVLKRVAEEYGVEFPIKEQKTDETLTPWWIQV